MEDVITADKVKPGYQKIKDIWLNLLSKYYDSEGKLNPVHLEYVNCQYCGKSDSHSAFTLNGFKHVTCSNCDSVYVTPRLKNEHLAELYADQYYSEMYTQSMIPVFETRKQLIGQRKAAQVLNYWTASPGRVLDIGCGIGEVIDAFKDQAWDCHAIEVNPSAINWLHRKKIHVFEDMFENYPLDEKFDVIMAWGVLEHVLNPDLFLKKIVEHLNPGGIFASEVPNGQSLLVDYCRQTGVDPGRILMGEQHIILFSVNAYEELHVKNGLTKLHTQTNGLDVETILGDAASSSLDVSAFQHCIDRYGKGDLIRGIWKKL